MPPTPQPQPAPEPRPLAEVIREMEAGFKRLLASGLNKNAVAVLLRDYTGVGKRDIERVLDGLGALAKQYTRPEGK